MTHLQPSKSIPSFLRFLKLNLSSKFYESTGNSYSVIVPMSSASTTFVHDKYEDKS